MDFINDEEKIQDYFKLTKDEFLESYSYLTEEDYNATTKALEKLGNISRIDILKEMLINKFNEINYDEAKEDVISFVKNSDSLDIWSKEFFISITNKLEEKLN